MKVKSSRAKYLLSSLLFSTMFFAQSIQLPPKGREIAVLLGAKTDKTQALVDMPKILAVENDIDQFFGLFIKKPDVLDEVTSNFTTTINGYEIPYLTQEITDQIPTEKQSLLQKIVYALKSIPIPVYQNKVNVDNKINWTAMMAMFLKRPVNVIVKSLLKILPNIHFFYKHKLDTADFEGNYPAAQTMFAKQELHELLNNPNFSTLFKYTQEYETSWPTWGDFYINLDAPLQKK